MLNKNLWKKACQDTLFYIKLEGGSYLKILFIGDVFGRPGRNVLRNCLETLKTEYFIDLVIANVENAAGGNGLTITTAEELFSYGIDIMTSGNHIWDKKEVLELLNKENKILRPLNYPLGTPGKGYVIIEKNGYKVAVINLLGRVYNNSLVDCPFKTLESVLEKIYIETPIIIVDFHAEATSEKYALGWFADGKVSAICGTHTHVQTADNRILEKGTAYITDVGMTGPYNSIIGIESNIVIEKFLKALPVRFEVAKGPTQFNGVYIEIDERTGKATDIQRLFFVYS